MRRRVGITILGASLLAVSALWLFTRASAYLPASPPPRYVVLAAEEMALSSGDPHPVLAYAIRTTEAMALTGSPHGHVAAPATRVYFVVLYGRFTANWASPPTGAATPTGTVVEFTVNRKTHGVTDMMIGNQTPNFAALESFGRLESFRVPSAGPAPVWRNIPGAIRPGDRGLTAAVVAQAVFMYVKAHTDIRVGLPVQIALPATDRWLWARVSATRRTYLGTPPGYTVMYYATRHPYSRRHAPPPSLGLLQISGNKMVRRLPTKAHSRLEYFWNALPIGPGPGGPGMDTGPAVPVSLSHSVYAVRYPDWGDSIQWTQGSWSIIFQDNGTRSSGMRMAEALSRLFRKYALPPDPGLVVVNYSQPSPGAPSTTSLFMAWVRHRGLYTVNDSALPIGQMLAMVKDLQWSRP